MEQDLHAKVQAARIAHHANPTPESSAKVKAAHRTLNEHLADGAKPCDCGAVPHVMLRREVPISGVLARLYEAGCLTCRITNGDKDDKGNPIAYPRRAQGTSAAEAVANWNNGKLVFIRPAVRLLKVKADGSQQVMKEIPHG